VAYEVYGSISFCLRVCCPIWGCRVDFSSLGFEEKAMVELQCVVLVEAFRADIDLMDKNSFVQFWCYVHQLVALI
jgi:hypothetical protein